MHFFVVVMVGASIGATAIPSAPIATCLATVCAISTSVVKICARKEKKMLKENNETE